jgi:hypothetical protein
VANRYYVGNGGLAAGWNNAAFWSLVSGGAGGASVPGVADVAIFDGPSPTCTPEAGYNPSVLGLTLAVGFLATLTLAVNNNTLTVGATGAVLQNALGFLSCGTGTVTFNGPFTQSGCTMTCGTLTIFNGTSTWTAGTFTCPVGTTCRWGTNFNGVFTVPVQFYDVEVNSGGNVINGAGATITNNLTVTTINAWTLNGDITLLGNLVVNNANPPNYASAGAILFSGGAPVISGAGKTPSIKAALGAGTLSLANAISVVGSWTWVSGVFAHNNFAVSFISIGAYTINTGQSFYDLNILNGNATLAADVNVARNYRQDVGSGFAGGKKIYVKGDADFNITATASPMLNTIVLNDAAADQNLKSTVAGTALTPPIEINKAGGTARFANNQLKMAAFAVTAGAVDYSLVTLPNTIWFGTGNQVGHFNCGAANTIPNLTVRGGAADFYLDADLYVTNTLVLTTSNTMNGPGVLHFQGSALDLQGTITSTGTLVVTIDGAGDQTLKASGGTGDMPGLRINKAAGTLHLQNIIRVKGSGVGGLFDYVQGTIDAGTSTLYLWYYINAITIAAPYPTFYNVEINCSGNANLTGTLVVGNNLVVSGNPGSFNGGTIQVYGNLAVTVAITCPRGTTLWEFVGPGDTVITQAAGPGKLYGTSFTVLKATSAARVVLGTACAFNIVAGGTQAVVITTGTLDLAGFNLAISGTLTITDTLKWWGSETLTYGARVIGANSTVWFYGAGAYTVTVWSAAYATLALGGAGTYNLGALLTCGHGFNCLGGTVNTNGNTVNAESMLLDAALVALNAGASTITLSADGGGFPAALTNKANNVFNGGTSQVTLTGTSSIVTTAGSNIALYRLTVAAAGKNTRLNAVGSVVAVNNRLATGTGTCSYVAGSVLVQGPGADAFLPNVATAYDWPTTLSSEVGGAAQTVHLNPCVYGPNAAITLQTNGGTGQMKFVPTAAVVIPALYGQQVNGDVNALFDLGGFNLGVTGNVDLALGITPGLSFNVGAATMTIGGNFANGYVSSPDLRYFAVANGGQLLVAGSITLGNSNPTVGIIKAEGNAHITCGGNWSSAGNTGGGATGLPVWGEVQSATSIMEFASAGPFTITEGIGDVWPKVVFTGAGSTTLPNGFTCTNMDITNPAAHITAGNPFTCLANLNNNGTFTGSANMYIGSSFVNTGTYIDAGSNIIANGPIVTVDVPSINRLTLSPNCLRMQVVGHSIITIAVLTIQDRIVPGVIQFSAGSTYNIGILDSQIVAEDGLVQLVSSVAGTRYAFNVTGAITSLQWLWPRDSDASASFVVPVGDLTNRNLGHNLGWVLNSDGQLRVISEDPGQDILAENSIGQIQYCWLVDTVLAGLAAKATAFAAGANNYHRKTNIPFAVLDNLNIGTSYFVALALADDRDRRVVPNVLAGDYATAKAYSGGGGGAGGGGNHNLAITTKMVAFG